MPLISSQDLQNQQDYLDLTFLKIPNQVSIHFVDDIISLQNAKEILLQQNSDGTYLHSFLGVDAEWKTTMPTPSNKRNRIENNKIEIETTDIIEEKEDIRSNDDNDGGASILQVNIPL